MSKRFEELKAKQDELTSYIGREGAKAFQELCRELFNKHPNLEMLSFIAYTPYFNDGDICYYSYYDLDEYKLSNFDSSHLVDDDMPYIRKQDGQWVIGGDWDEKQRVYVNYEIVSDRLMIDLIEFGQELGSIGDMLRDILDHKEGRTTIKRQDNGAIEVSTEYVKHD